ncbi:MAG: hypothetical protein EA362_00745 [Saprospirales bacterium]|nr:MAG: hypothetical protein EA362_00745 [Saprospirales bacterium]
MHIPRWKKWLSYLFEMHIESSPGDLNPHLYVSLKRGRFQLCTKNAVYSYEDKYDNFKRIFSQLNLDFLQNGNVLILGFGLGSVPILLKQIGLNELSITGIELDENVIYLASKYALNKIDYPTEMIETDAAAFIFSTYEQYDLVVVDVFVDDIIPEQCRNLEFLEACKDRLTENGILLFNALAATDEDKDEAEQLYFETFEKVFPTGKLVDVLGNYIFVSNKSALKNES